jgi:hypothetical protein
LKRKLHVEGRKHCASCDEWKGLEDFHQNKRNWDGLHAYCRPCMAATASKRYQRERDRLLGQAKAYRAANPEKRKAVALRFKFGIEIDEYQRLREKQNDRCAICERPAVLHVDHCHSSGSVRGLLCMPCNTALGSFGDDPERIRRAASYVEDSR